MVYATSRGPAVRPSGRPLPRYSSEIRSTGAPVDGTSTSRAPRRTSFAPQSSRSSRTREGGYPGSTGT